MFISARLFLPSLPCFITDEYFTFSAKIKCWLIHPIPIQKMYSIFYSINRKPIVIVNSKFMLMSSPSFVLFPIKNSIGFSSFQNWTSNLWQHCWFNAPEWSNLDYINLSFLTVAKIREALMSTWPSLFYMHVFWKLKILGNCIDSSIIIKEYVFWISIYNLLSHSSIIRIIILK